MLAHRSDVFVDRLKPHAVRLCQELIPPLYRGGKLFWNPTVNRMTGLVLKRLQVNKARILE